MSRFRYARRWWIGILLASATTLAHAHKPSDSYLSLRLHDAVIELHWDIALRDLDNSLGLDANDDGELSWGEVKQRARDIEALAYAHLRLSANRQPCKTLATPTPLMLDTHSDGAYAVLQTRYQCASTANTIEIDYTLFADIDPTHRAIVRIDQANGGTQTAVLDPTQAASRITVQAPNGWSALAQFITEGVWHIWLGFDHLLFLLALLLPSVLTRSGTTRQWNGVARLRPALMDVIKIVTSFTIAHSITLSLAVLGVLSPPVRWIESAIALTVVLAGINNLWPVLRDRRWLAAFVFGLIHGFGFAAALRDLGLPTDALALSLLGFNIGVELGQLAVVLLFVPVAYRLRMTGFYQRGVMGAGSLVVIGLALVWLVERVWDIKLL